MKTLACVLLAMALPIAASAQAAKAGSAPEKSVLITSYRIEPKPGHTAALRAALAAHAQKFHKGDSAWRVGEVMSGPDGGMFHITEGPTSWTALDGRGDLGAEHTKDYETNVQPHVEKSTPDTIFTYQASMSTVAANKFSNKVLIRRITVKPGRGSEAADLLRRYKTIYEKMGLNMVVWHSAWSGENTYSIVFRLKNGLKDLDDDTPSTRKTAEDLYGPNEYGRLQQAAADNFSKVVDEIIEFKPDLGSKS